MRKDLRKRVILALGMFLLLSLSSCAWLNKGQIQKERAQKEQLDRERAQKERIEKEHAQKEQVQKRTDYADKQAQTELEAGRFQGAIDLFEEIYQEYPQEPNVRSGFIRTLESIKSRGDQAFERKDFKLAERIYEVLATNWGHFSDFSQSLSFGEDFLEKKIRTSRCLLTEEQVSSHLKAGEFRKAIDVSKGIYKKYPQDPAVRRGYIRTLESIKASGDRAFEGNDFALAGRAYEIVLRNINPVSHVNASFSFSREGLTGKIGDCRKILFEKGLEQYRSGNLNQAIKLWKSILAFDPENREIRKAVDMATLQSENLQKARE